MVRSPIPRSRGGIRQRRENLGRTPSKYAARIAQVLAAAEPGVKIRRDQWEEQEELGPHTDDVGTISPELADMIWVENCRSTGP